MKTRILVASCATVLLSGFLCGCSSSDAEAESHFDRGVAHFDKGEYDAALAAWNQALAIKQDYAEAYVNMGIAYGKLGQYALALTACNKATAIKPNYAGAYCNRAVAYYFRREYDNAWADVKNCHRLGGQVPPGFLAELRKASGRATDGV